MPESCPICHNSVSQLQPVQAGMKIALETTGEYKDVPAAVCMGCHEDLSGRVSQGVKLRMAEEEKHKNKVKMWQNRIALLKQGRSLMEKKALPEAAMCFEKYLKVIEIIYEKKPGDLSPDIFSKSTRSKELTVVTTVYWDLVRIYDTNRNYHTRLLDAVDKLGQFAPYSTVYPTLVRKAEQFVKRAKNPAPIKAFLKKSRGKKVGCFIATASFDGPFEPEVIQLKVFRDEVLKKSFLGRKFIDFYYFVSPSIAWFINKHSTVKPFTRAVLRGIIKLLP